MVDKFVNPYTNESLSDGSYVLGTRPQNGKDGIPLWIFNIKGGIPEFCGHKEIKQVFEMSLIFILKSGNWCTLKEVDNENNTAKYMVANSLEIK